MSLIDYNATLTGLDGDQELFCRLGEMFCEDTPILMDDLWNHVQMRNSAGAKETLHALKGMAAQFYAGAAVELFAELETLAKSGDTQTTLQRYEEIRKVVEDIKSELVEWSRTGT